MFLLAVCCHTELKLEQCTVPPDDLSGLQLHAASGATPDVSLDIILVCNALQSGSVWACNEMSRQPHMMSPSWLAPIAKDAHVQPLAMKMLDAYLCPCPDGGSLGLAGAVNSLTGQHSFALQCLSITWSRIKLLCLERLRALC